MRSQHLRIRARLHARVLAQEFLIHENPFVHIGKEAGEAKGRVCTKDDKKAAS